MSGEKTTTTSSQTATATPEERELERLQLDRQKANAPMQQQLDTNQYGLANLLLTGQNLPGNLQGAQGVSDQQTQNMSSAAVRDVLPQFQSAGILDSGIAVQGATRAAADVRNQNAQFNVQAFQQLLNQALGGSSNLTSSNTQSNQVLGSQLAGLRTINTSGSTIGMNPFLKSFQTSLGNSFGKAIPGAIGGSMSGGMGSGAGITSALGGG